MTEPAPYAISGQIILDDIAYPVTGAVGYNNLGRFAQKATLGDYSRDSDDLQSAWILTDWSGGFGRFNLRAGVDENRYWTGVIWAREPYGLTNPRRSLELAGPNSDGFYPLGVLNDRMYVACGTAVLRWNETTLAFETPPAATLAFAPVSQYSVVAQGLAAHPWVIIPQGVNGYQDYDGTTLSAVHTAIHPLAFAKWDDRLWALDVNGKLWSTVDPPGEVTVAWIEQAQLDGSEEPRNLLVYLDRQEQWALYVVSDRAVWWWDALNTKLVMTHFNSVFHPDMGRGVAVWRPGEDAFISAGLQVYDWNLVSVNPMGPGNPDGLPLQLRGRVMALAAEINSLYAMVEGSPAPLTGEPEAEEVVADTPFDDTLYAASQGALCSVMCWTGFGWHVYWTSPSFARVGEPTAIWIETSQETVRLWWSCMGMAYTQKIPRDMASMRQLIDMGQGDFARDGYLDTGWFDAGMRGFDKLESHLELNLDYCERDRGEYVDVFYMTDTDRAWTSLGRAERVGRTVLPFGLEGDGFSRGMPNNRIRLLFRLHGDSETSSPLVDSIVVKYLKLPLSSGAWRVTIPLDFDLWGSRTAAEIKRDLDELLAKREFVKLQFGEHTPRRRVRVTSLDGTDDTGWSQLGRRDIAIAEMDLPPDSFKDPFSLAEGAI